MCCPRVSERYHVLSTCVWTLPCAVRVCLNVTMCCPRVSERHHVLSARVWTLPCAVRVCLNVTMCCPRVSERYHVLSACVWTLSCAARACLNVTMCCPRVSERYYCNSWIRWPFPQISPETLLLESCNLIIFCFLHYVLTTWWLLQVWDASVNSNRQFWVLKLCTVEGLKEFATSKGTFFFVECKVTKKQRCKIPKSWS